MPIDIYHKEFQNWLKGVIGLNTTRSALCECLLDKLNDNLKSIPRSELAQFFNCLESNQIARLMTQRKSVTQWECRHDNCRILMDRFVDNHTQKDVIRYNWTQTSSGSDKNTDLNEDNDLTWKVIKLYMYVEKDVAAENYTSLKSLDVSHIIKLMRNYQLFYPDGSAELYDKVLNSRNELMHSPNNLMNEEKIKKIIKTAKELLDCLDLEDKSYYKSAVQELKDLAEKEFVVKYQTKECKQILENVLMARNIAAKLYKDIEEENHQLKRQIKQLQDMLEQIYNFGATTKLRLEMKPDEYKSIVKETLEKKHETIVSDKAEYDEESEMYKEFEELRQRTEQDIQEVKIIMQKPEPEEMTDIIDNLIKKLEKLDEEKKELKAEVIKYKMEDESSKVNKGMDIESGDNIDNTHQESMGHWNRLEKYQKDNHTQKATTKMRLEVISDENTSIEYNSIIKEKEKKQETIELDKAEYHKESEMYKEFEELIQRPEQDIQEVKIIKQKQEPEGMAEKIDNLIKKLEKIDEEKKESKAEVIKYKKKDESSKVNKGMDIESGDNIDNTHQESMGQWNRLEEYQKDNHTQKATTKLRLEMKPDAIKSIVKETLEKKQEIIVLDEESKTNEESVKLRQRKEQDVKEVKIIMQNPEPDEMAEIIDNLRKTLETLFEGKIEFKAETIA